MTENGEKLLDLMLHLGYPYEFASIIAQEMQTEYTSQRMTAFLGKAGLIPADMIADEMLSILAERDRLVQKHITEHAQRKINELYYQGGFDDGEDEDQEDTES